MSRPSPSSKSSRHSNSLRPRFPSNLPSSRCLSRPRSFSNPPRCPNSLSHRQHPLRFRPRSLNRPRRVSQSPSKCLRPLWLLRYHNRSRLSHSRQSSSHLSLSPCRCKLPPRCHRSPVNTRRYSRSWLRSLNSNSSRQCPRSQLPSRLRPPPLRWYSKPLLPRWRRSLLSLPPHRPRSSSSSSPRTAYHRCRPPLKRVLRPRCQRC
jgi:hypothetical protein